MGSQKMLWDDQPRIFRIVKVEPAEEPDLTKATLIPTDKAKNLMKEFLFNQVFEKYRRDPKELEGLLDLDTRAWIIQDYDAGPYGKFVMYASNHLFEHSWNMDRYYRG